jgi:antitoxin YefM
MQVIENYVPITQAKSKLLDMVRSLHKNDDTYAITKNGVPEAVLISMDKFEGLLETIEILADTQAMDQLKGSVLDVKNDRLLDMEKIL